MSRSINIDDRGKTKGDMRTMDEGFGMCLGFGTTREDDESSMVDDLKEMPELLPAEDISAERMAAMVHYCTEHQMERFAELLEFFTAECRALFQEAWEATADADPDGR